MDAEQTVYHPDPVALPSDRAWIDPPLIGRCLYLQPTDIEFVAASVIQVAKPNPYRWAIGFAPAQSAPSSLFVAPWSDFAFAPGWTVAAGNPLWFRLPDFGPMVMAGWSGSAGGTGFFRLLEIIRITGG